MPKAKKTTAKKTAPKAAARKATRASVKAPVTSVTVNARPSAQERARKATAYVGVQIRKPKVFIPVIIVVVLALLFLFRSAFVVAIVNGQPVSRMSYEKQLQAQAGKQVMNSLVTQSLIEQEAAREHVSVSQAELDTQLRTIQNQLASQGQTLDSALAAQGLSQDTFMQQLKLQALVEKMLADKIKVTDAEVNDYITKNQASLPTGESESQIKAQVKTQLQQQKLSSQAQALVQQLQAKAHITYFVSY